ncbi:hypothetical protein C8R44DRAFT_537095, partial [Mycena epipterygia]
INPWLNGHVPSPTFHFDLARGQFTPLRVISNPRQIMKFVAVNIAELYQSAFDPPLTALRIFHPGIPLWPVDVEPSKELRLAHPRPISVGDVLVALHQAMHQPIMPSDFTTLTRNNQEAVRKAFMHRCCAVAAGTPLRLKQVERNQGVKRVDFLLGETLFKGLV